MKTPKYDLIVGTNEHNAVIIATGRYDQIQLKRKRIRRADRRGVLYIEMIRQSAGPGVVLGLAV